MQGPWIYGSTHADGSSLWPSDVRWGDVSRQRDLVELGERATDYIEVENDG